MLRLLIRFFGLISLAGGFAALIVDGTRSLAGGALAVTSSSAALLALFPGKLKSVETALDERSPLASSLLEGALAFVPLSLALTAVGVLFILLSQRRRRPIDYFSRP